MAFWKKSKESDAIDGGPEKPASASVTNHNGGHPLQSISAIGTSPPPEMNGRAPELSSEELSKIATTSKALMGALGEIIALLMRAPQYKHYTLADLEWLVVPALMTGQFSLATAQSKANGSTAPVGLVLWASVSEEIDTRLRAAAEQPVRLRPQEWKSGDILWVISAVGNERVVQGMIKGIQEKQWAQKPAKAFARGPDGKPIIVVFDAKAA